MAGRPPKPTKLKLVQGNPGKRPLPEFEPEPERGIPAPPAWFPADYFDLWAEIAPTLEEMRVLSLADGPALVLLVSAYAEWHSARKVLETEGRTYGTRTATGEPVIKSHPMCVSEADLWKRVCAMLQQFGLTPSARSKVHAGEAAHADPYEEWREKRGHPQRAEKKKKARRKARPKRNPRAPR